MNTIKKDLVSLFGDECFVYMNHTYITSNYSLNCILRQSLPTVSSQYEQLLIDNNIAYNKLENNLCEIYDENCYEFEEITLPVYVFNPLKKCYTYTGKSHTKRALSEETLIAAQAVERTIQALIHDAKLKDLSEEIKSLLDNHEIIFIAASAASKKKAFEIRSFSRGLLEKYRYYTTMVFSNSGSLLGYILLDLAKAEGKSVLDMEVPENLIGRVIGAGGRNIKSLVTEINYEANLHISRINVHKITSE